MTDPVQQPPTDLVPFTMDGVAYEGRPTTVASIRGLLAECKITGHADVAHRRALDDLKQKNADLKERMAGMVPKKKKK